MYLAVKIKWLRPHFLSLKEQEKLTMLEFRSLALLFGFDVSNMSDEEIKEGVVRASKAMSMGGVTAYEAGIALRNMALSAKSITHQN